MYANEKNTKNYWIIMKFIYVIGFVGPEINVYVRVTLISGSMSENLYHSMAYHSTCDRCYLRN